MKMTKSVNDDSKALEEKRVFFDAKIKERRKNQHGAITTGFLILASVLIYDFFAITLLGAIAIIIGVILSIIIPPLVVRFVWAPWDVCWVSIVKPNCFKVLTRGGDLRRPIANNIAFTDKWEPVKPDHSDAIFFDESLWGVHIISNWPFTQVDEKKMEYRRYDERLKSAPLKRELMVEFTLMVYPYYVEILDAKDANKADVRMGISWMARMTNIKQALYGEATSMIDVCAPLIKGGMGSFIQNHTVEQIRSLQDVGRSLFEEMPSPRPIALQDQSETLIEMIKSQYGMKTESISKIFFKGDNEQVEEAINAKAIEGFRRDAKLVNADAESRSLSITTIGAAIDMLAQTIVTIDFIEDNEEEGERRDPEEERKRALLKAKNYLAIMRKEQPEEFKKWYGEEWERCVDIVTRDMIVKKGGIVADLRTPNATGSVADMQSLILTSNLVGSKAGGATKSSDSNKKAQSEDNRKKEFKTLKEAGFDIDDDEDE
jgi:hypothetical protein